MEKNINTIIKIENLRKELYKLQIRYEKCTLLKESFEIKNKIRYIASRLKNLIK